MPRGKRGGGISLAHDDEEDDFDCFDSQQTFHALISWPRFAERVVRLVRKLRLDKHARLRCGGVCDAPPVVPPPPAHVPAPASFRPLSRFNDAVMERLDAFDCHFTQIRADPSVHQTPWLVSKLIKPLNNLAYTVFQWHRHRWGPYFLRCVLT
ncbi:hypothetical protein Dimus_028596 [Dionaea muscipula]